MFFPYPKNFGGVTQAELASQLDQSLTIGMNKQDIERVFNSARLNYSFDNGLKRYQAALNQANAQCMRTYLYDCSIVVYLRLAQDDTYVSHEVTVIHSGL